MKHEISETCRLILSKNKAIVIIRNNSMTMAFCFIVLSSCLIVSIALLVTSSNIGDTLFSLILVLGIVCFCLFFIGLEKEYEIDLVKNILIQRNSIFGKIFKIANSSWPQDSYFKYEIFRDSYQNINEIYLIAVSTNDKKAILKLICFSDEWAFWKFRKLFNKKFPDHEILEWHD